MVCVTKTMSVCGEFFFDRGCCPVAFHPLGSYLDLESEIFSFATQ